MAPTGECCPGQSHGFMPESVDYEPQGAMQDVGGVPAYIVGSGTKTILLIHDIFGLHTGRHKQIADEFAKNGYFVVMPDFFYRATTPSGMFGTKEMGYGLLGGNTRFTCRVICNVIGGHMDSYMRQTPWSTCKSIWDTQVVPYLAAKSINRVAVIGFCWGAWTGFHISADDQTKMKIVAQVAMHPSVEKVAHTLKEDEKTLVISASKTPTLVFSTNQEPKSWQPGGATQEAMESEASRLGQPPKTHIRWRHFNQAHGFVTRGGMKGNLQLAEDVKTAMDETTAFVQQFHA